MDSSQPKLLDRFTAAMHMRGWSPRTIEAYVGWSRRFILFHGKQHPVALGPAAIEPFLSHLATDRNVAPSTQNQALNALISLYRDFLQIPVPDLEYLRAKRPKRLPVVFTKEEIRSLFQNLDGLPLLMARLLYGTGMRLNEMLTLRVKDIDFSAGTILIYDLRTVQELLGHTNVKTTQIYTHVLNKPGLGVRSPLEE